jgi:hypothetical protein
MPSGRNCKSPAMRNSAYCYYHGPQKAPRRVSAARDLAFEIEPIIDPASIQVIATQILQGMAANRLSKGKAAVMLQVLQTVVTGFKLPPSGGYDPGPESELDPEAPPFVPSP